MYYIKVLNAINDRLDAEYYSPEALQTIKKMGSRSELTTLGSLITEGYRVVYHGTDSVNTLTREQTLPFLSPSQIDKYGSISFDSIDYLPKYYKNDYPKGLAKAGELLIEVKGNVSKVGIVPATFPADLMISGSIYKAMLDNRKADSHYILAFLKSNHGQILKDRLTSNTIINYIAKDDLYSIPISLVDIEAQKYVGDKVRQAEQLRILAKKLRRRISDYFSSLFADIPTSKPDKSYSWQGLDVLVPRLNAEYYSDEYVQVTKGLVKKFGSLTTIGKKAPTVRSKQKPKNDCTYREISDLNNKVGAFGDGNFYEKGTAPNNAQRLFDEGDVAVSTRRPNRGAIAVVDESSNNTFYSVFLARLKPKKPNFGYWLKEYLRTDAGKLLLLQRCTWTTYPVISEDDLETVPVPNLEQDWQMIADLSKKSEQLEKLALTLTVAAKALVETLIEGQITQQQLIDAQQALEADDNALDQAILSKLTTKGFKSDHVIDSKPLFDDLDELYRLLKEAQEAEDV